MEGKWLRRPTSGTAVVFLHGVLSSMGDCWRHKNGAYWPDLLLNDSGAPQIGVYIYSYQTGIFSGTYRLGDVVDSLKEQMRLDGIFDCRTIIFVAHSMGGIVARKLVVSRASDFRERGINVGLFLVASPSLGSGYANLLAVLASAMDHTQADSLRFSQTNAWLLDLDREFVNLKEARSLKLFGKELVEDKFLVLKKLIRKQVVEPFSGAKYFGEPVKIPGSDHSSIAKPESVDAFQHRLLVRFISEAVQAEVLPIELELKGRLISRLDGCRKAEVPFRTFHRLAALFAMQSRFAPACFEATGPGMASQVEEWLRRTNAHQLNSEKALPNSRDPSEDPLMTAAGIIARSEGASQIDERHLLLAILDDSAASTVVELRRSLKTSGFETLQAVAKARRPQPHNVGLSNVLPLSS